MTRPLRDFILYCDRGSNTVSELRSRLNARRLYGEVKRRLRNTSGALILNYGTSHSPNWVVGSKSIVLNKPEAIQNAISKVKCHALLSSRGIPTLSQTTSRTEAAEWLRGGSGVLARRDGLSGGKGIIYLAKGSDQESLPPADFYAKYFPKTHEYRAHVVSGRLIDLTQKRLKNGMVKSEDSDPVAKIVRSLDNGWVHAHSFELGAVQRAEIEKVAVASVAALGLDFGAVDILAKYPRDDLARPPVLVVCEINTAPGLINEQTLEAYVRSFRQAYDDSSGVRAIPVVERVRRRKVKKQVLVWITTRKGARVQRLRDRWVYAASEEAEAKL